MSRVLAIIGTLALAFASMRAQSAEVKSRDFRDGKVRLDIVGEIQPGDANSVAAAIKAANDRTKMVATVRLNSVGGNILEAVKLADIIRNGKIATAVLSESTCASACFIVFSAGNEKYAHYTAQIGVHGASDPTGQETTEAEAATVSMARILRELGVPAPIIGKMVVTPPAQMVWLTPDDLKSMGVTMLGKPSQLGPPVAAQSAPPLQLTTPPSTHTQATAAKPTWGDMIKMAANLSIQAYGRLNSGRSCQPELKVCSNAILYRTKDGINAMIRTEENIDGKVIRRDICSFNSFGDVRTCLDWDAGRLTKEMKSSNGTWTLIESQ